MAQYNYIPTEPAKISSALDALFAEGGSAKSAAAASQSNLIVMATRDEEFEDLERIIDLVSLMHPSRIFVIWLKSGAAEIEAGVTARCHLVSGAEPVCSEIVRLITPPSRIDRVQSILYASFLTGMPTELLVHSSRVDKDLMKLLVPMTDRVIFDLREFESSPDDGFYFLDIPANMVDLEWLRLSPWRGELRGLFNKSVVSQHLSGIERIELVSAVRRAGGSPVGGLLMAGWLLNCMHAVPVAYGAGGCECRGEGIRPFTLAIESPLDALRPGLSELRMKFDKSGTGHLAMRRGAQQLESSVHLGSQFRAARPLEDDGQAALLERYFLHGGSSKRYGEALKTARDLEYLRRGFLTT